jgi:hypothetical protein
MKVAIIFRGDNVRHAQYDRSYIDAIQCYEKWKTNIFDDLFDYNRYEKTYMNKDMFNNNTPVYDITSSLIGRTIFVVYYPYSQKYIEYYDEQEVMGKIFFVDEINKDIFMYYDKIVDDNSVRVIKSLNRDYCSYYGDVRGYDFSIYLI